MLSWRTHHDCVCGWITAGVSVGRQSKLGETAWNKMRVEHEVNGKSFGELAEIFGVNKSNICRRAKAEGWQQANTQQLIVEIVEHKRNERALEEKTQQLNATLRNAVLDESAKRLAFEERSNRDLQALSDKALKLGLEADDVRAVKTAAEVVMMNREANLGKAPTTAIQINNTGSMSAIDALHAERFGGVGHD